MVVCNKRYPYDSARAAKQLSARVQSKPQLFSDKLVELYDICKIVQHSPTMVQDSKKASGK